MIKKRLLSVLILVLMVSGAAYSQIRVPKPDTVIIFSSNQMFKAVTETALGKTTLYRLERTGPKKLWHLYGKVHVLGVSNDGEYLVVGGGNYLPSNYTPDMPLLSIYKRDKLARTIPLNQVIKDFGSLPRTWQGTYLWGYYKGFGNDGKYWVQTLDKRQHGIDPATGRVTSR